MWDTPEHHTVFRHFCTCIGHGVTGALRAACPLAMTFRTSLAFARCSLLALALPLAFATFACSPTNQTAASNEGGGGSDQSTGSNPGGGGEGGLGIGGMGNGGSTGTGTFEACAQASEVASTLPLNMFIAIDKSGSMNDDDKWDNAKSAFTSFFQDPVNQAGKINVALRFWPDGNCNGDSCDINACSQAQADLGPLSDAAHVQELVSLYNSKGPDGNTPMFAALGGAAKWGIEHAQASEGAEVTVIVFVTDGEPNGCDENIDHIAKHAADAFATAKVPTFAVGLVGSNEGDMAKIATAGNTMTPFLIGNGNAEQELAAALKAIQKSTLACVFAMPEATGADPIDPELVNLTYTPEGAGPVTIGQVGSEAECGPAGGWGWYYDNPENPAIFTLCPALCTNVQKDDGGKIEVILGCETKPA